MTTVRSERLFDLIQITITQLLSFKICAVPLVQDLLNIYINDIRSFKIY